MAKKRTSKNERFMEFEALCKMKPSKIKSYLYSELKKTHAEVINNDGYLYAKGTHPVILTAHMDTVHESYDKWFVYEDKGNKITSPQGIGGDDRCGIFMILQIVKKINCSVIFCEEEEVGLIGAGKFATDYDKGTIEPIDANYIIEFDRRGHYDAVYYDLDNLEFEQFITQSSGGHFKTAMGSCSDISEIAPVIGIAAVNLSCGYYDEHQLKESVIKSEMLENIEKAKLIINTSVEKPYEYKEIPWRSKWGAWDDYGWFGGHSKASSYDWRKKDYDDIPQEWEIYFEDYDGIEATDYVEATSEDEAIGIFVRLHPYTCYEQIWCVRETLGMDYTSVDRLYIQGLEQPYEYEAKSK